jgi:hypothetical protein
MAVWHNSGLFQMVNKWAEGKILEQVWPTPYTSVYC